MRNQRGKGPENPGRLLKRLMGMLMKHYGAAIIIVAICIIINVLANVQGTMFMQRLIDDYITPLLKSETKNYTPLLHAMDVSHASMESELLLRIPITGSWSMSHREC